MRPCNYILIMNIIRGGLGLYRPTFLEFKGHHIQKNPENQLLVGSITLINVYS